MNNTITETWGNYQRYTCTYIHLILSFFQIQYFMGKKTINKPGGLVQKNESFRENERIYIYIYICYDKMYGVYWCTRDFYI